MKRFILFLLSSILIVSCSKTEVKVSKNVITGADVLITDSLHLLKNKSVGIVTNHTGVLANGTHIIDTLHSIEGITLKALFGPEHGIRGDEPDGAKISDGIDDKTGTPVYSLYGKIRKPTEEMLKDVEVLIFDIQDIGARFYTFISTMYNIIESAAENDIPLIIIDRPNPIGGLYVDGPLRTEELKSFVAIAPIPIAHGMTVGELAIMFNEEKFIETEKKAAINVIKMKNWKREMFYDECGLTWVNPSPNMPNIETAIVYPGVCFIEGTNISEGRGTFNPFLEFGAPFLNSANIISKLNSYNLAGLKFSPVEYTPKEIRNMSKYPKFKNEKCNGVNLTVTDREAFKPVEFGVYLIHTLYNECGEDFSFRKNWLDKLFGNTYFKEMIKKGNKPEEIINAWKSDLEQFKTLRKQYLLY